jgi:hypothetical protein
MGNEANSDGRINARALLAIVLEWYANAEVWIVVAAQDFATRLPASCKGFTALRIEPNNPRNVQGMELGRDGFSARLAFSGEPFDVFVPWRAIVNVQVADFAIAFHTAIAEPKDTPPDQPPKLRIVK